MYSAIHRHRRLHQETRPMEATKLLQRRARHRSRTIQGSTRLHLPLIQSRNPTELSEPQHERTTTARSVVFQPLQRLLPQERENRSSRLQDCPKLGHRPLHSKRTALVDLHPNQAHQCIRHLCHNAQIVGTRQHSQIRLAGHRTLYRRGRTRNHRERDSQSGLSLSGLSKAGTVAMITEVTRLSMVD